MRLLALASFVLLSACNYNAIRSSGPTPAYTQWICRSTGVPQIDGEWRHCARDENGNPTLEKRIQGGQLLGEPLTYDERSILDSFDRRYGDTMDERDSEINALMYQ